MPIQIKLKDGRIVSPAEHYAMLCEEHGLTPGSNIKRDPNNRERWIENDTEYTVLSPETAKWAQEECPWL